MSSHFRRLTGLLVFLVIWETTSLIGVVPQDFMPGLGEIGGRLWQFLADGEIYWRYWITAQRVLLGLVIALVIAIGLATIAGRYPAFRRTLQPLADILRSLPPPVLVPLLILVLGIGSKLYYFVVVFGSMWPTYISASNALATAEPVQVNTARSLGLTDWEIMTQVRVPAALPEIFTGIRLSASIALLATVASEMLLGGNGIGAMIYNAGFSLLWADMYALMFVIGLSGIALNAAVEGARWLFAGWSARYAAMGDIA